ncbi:hypothetical protein Tco_0542104 [Tanacetum coccineum]
MHPMVAGDGGLGGCGGEVIVVVRGVGDGDDGRDDDGGSWVPAAVGRKSSPEMGAAPKNGREKMRLGNHLTKRITMAAPDLKGTHAHPCLSNPNPAKPKSNINDKIEISTELIMKLRNNAYHGVEANDAEKGYDNDTLIDDDESSDDESSESNQHPSFNPYQNDDEMGDKSHQKECKDSSNIHENFDTTHSDVNERQDEGMCRTDRFEVIKYSIGDNEEFLGVRALEHQSWVQTVNRISSIYLDIFCKKDEGWTVHRTK